MFRFASYQRPSSSIQRLLALTTCALFLGTSTPILAAPLAASGGTDSQLASSSSSANAKAPRILFVSPTFGGAESGSNVTVTLAIRQDQKLSSLKVKLNGHDVSARIFSSSCRRQTCTMTGTVATQDGLKVGANRLWASINSADGTQGDVQRTSFSYQDQLSSGQGANAILNYDPASVGISTVAPGGAGPGKPWIQITTGMPMGVSDPIASLSLPTTTDSVSIPYADVQFSTDCKVELQAIALDRTMPSVIEATACARTVKQLQTTLNDNLRGAKTNPHSLGSSDLVILGTTSARVAPDGLDTSDFGGTDYSTTPEDAYPDQYMLIGVFGAAAGTAHESYSIFSSTGTGAPSLNGTLMVDNNGNYNYVPSGDQLFSVTSGADITSTGITIGGKTYTPPTPPDSTLSVGAFWLLALDRETLQPVTYTSTDSHAPWTPCAPNLASQACGGIFPVGAFDGVATDLGNALHTSSPRNLLFLVTAGCPFQQAGSNLAATLDFQVAPIGGVGPSMMNLYTGSNTCAYSLVSVNDGKHSDVLTGKASFSANQYSAQQQLGALQGYLARDKSGLYDVAGKAQAGQGEAATSVDYTFEQAAASQRIDWPLTSSISLLAAYHDISYQLLNKENETGSYIYDMRYFYTNASIAAELISEVNLLNPTGKGTLKQSSWDTKATPSDFAAAKAQLSTELLGLQSAAGYLIGGASADGGIRGVLTDSQAPILSNMFAVAGDITVDQFKASSTADATFSNSLNLAAGVVSISAGIAAAVLPPLGIALGIFSGALWAGSAAASLDEGGGIPGPETPFEVTITKLASDSGLYVGNMLNGFDGAVDNIFTDWGKLQIVSGHTSDSDSAWNIKDQTALDNFNTLLIAGGTRSLWFDVLPSVIGTRFMPVWPSPDPRTYGEHLPGLNCISVYQTNDSHLPPGTVKAYNLGTLTGTKTMYQDVILAEGIAPGIDSGTFMGIDTGVSRNLAALLTTSNPVTIGGLSQTGLNITPDILFNNGPLPSTPAAVPYPLNGHASVCVSPLGNGTIGGAETSFTISGSSTGVVGQRSGSYVITPTGQNGKLNREFHGTVAVALTGPGNTRLHTNITFHGRPESVDFRSVYPKPGIYTMKVTSGSLDATKQIAVESVEVEEHASATKVTRNTPVTLTAEVSANGQPITDGRILFTLNNRTLDSARLGSDGEVSFTTNRLPVGNNRIAAIYRSPRPYATVEASDVLTVRVVQRN